MTKIAYLQCPTGIAGDMCLGALVHAGVPLEYLIEKLNLLGISQEYRLRAETVHRQGQTATKIYVDLNYTPTNPDDTDKEPPTFDRHHHQHHEEEERDRHSHHSHHSHPHHRHLPEIEEKIVAAGLPARAEKWSLAIFRQLAEAEAAVHGLPPEKVHFHEVGATDAIVDIVGTCLGLDWLEIDRLYCSPLPVGGGTVWAAHGRLPVPVPAVLKLWESRQVPVYSNGIERELVTPTGAAIACTLATDFGEVPPMSLECVGLGAGSRDLAIPNVLRLWMGKEGIDNRERAIGNSPQFAESGPQFPEVETISVLETQIDDCSPQAIAYTFDALFAVGALDVFGQAIAMKKSRQGILLTVICHPEKLSACEAIIFRETTTLGIRRLTQQRAILPREIQTVQTEYGEVRVKIAKVGDRIINAQPEYEDCAKLAREQNQSWREVHRIALQAWYSLPSA